jgi:alpha-tubulin suppressor-like RCC1 family protein
MNSKRRLMGILIVAAYWLSVPIESFGQPRVIVPIVKPAPNDFFDITAGDYHTCAIKNNGNVYCWGLNSTGQVGIATNTLCQSLRHC